MGLLCVHFKMYMKNGLGIVKIMFSLPCVITFPFETTIGRGFDGYVFDDKCHNGANIL